jgi:hypothetical protein
MVDAKQAYSESGIAPHHILDTSPAKRPHVFQALLHQVLGLIWVGKSLIDLEIIEIQPWLHSQHHSCF